MMAEDVMDGGHLIGCGSLPMIDDDVEVGVALDVLVVPDLVVCAAACVAGATSANAMGRRRDQRTEAKRIEWLMNSSFSRRGVRTSETREKRPR